MRRWGAASQRPPHLLFIVVFFRSDKHQFIVSRNQVEKKQIKNSSIFFSGLFLKLSDVTLSVDFHVFVNSSWEWRPYICMLNGRLVGSIYNHLLHETKTLTNTLTHTFHSGLASVLLIHCKFVCIHTSQRSQLSNETTVFRFVPVMSSPSRWRTWRYFQCESA